MGYELGRLLIESWKNTENVINATDDLLSWIQELNASTYVNINEANIDDSTFWFYDDINGEVLNRRRSFFSVKGIRYFKNNEFVSEQPIIVQPEIGYLGIICKIIDGVLYFLMQAKIEPGNVNCVQISPTIQATKSNFERAHGGKLPKYFDYFENSSRYNVIYDQIQSEQATRFYKKRNRNMIMLVEDDIEVLQEFKWMTLGQIKQLMDIDNLVNMDTRTVLSGVPFISMLGCGVNDELETLFEDKALYKSIYKSNPIDMLPQIYQLINNCKMFQDMKTVMVPLNQLEDWSIDSYGITCKKQASFMVRYFDIEISGREVQKWTQPLFKAIGTATFGLLTRTNSEGIKQFLVRITPEIGSFDKVELGPSVYWEPTHYDYNDNKVDKLFRKNLERKKNISIDVLLSEEGGRFYHEQNRNVIMDITGHDISLDDEYIWVDFATLNYLTQVNNCLNIQLRNLLSLLKL